MGLKETTGNIVANYSSDAFNAALFGIAGADLVQGRLLSAAVFGVLGARNVIQDHKNLRRNQQSAEALIQFDRVKEHGRGVRLGRSQVQESMELIAEAQFQNGEPIYTPLDGSSPIQTPVELMASLGGDIQSISTRIELILRHGEKREDHQLTTRENEALRRAQVLIRLAGIHEGDLDYNQRKRLYDIGNRVSSYEYQMANSSK